MFQSTHVETVLRYELRPSNLVSNQRSDEGDKGESLCSSMLIITVFSMIKNGVRYMITEKAIYGISEIEEVR
jgi:hypothetical protein